ncbi:aspartate racemase [Amycolatopsis bartoniae]|uniref:Aspartate racemase n=1 Tax=Amycolatopsis bartoniae TaxID=941986 RepID=A0A8H9IVL3_9PSEU|nr:amino acid racemase [Amycolatopsis bartoniae]MBB2940210.1 aspartate racemase [Amycolatopsis bartoniae]TVT11300.1 amino acid racemase [Amycolatopsis bartoniae]GHF66434.1 aspartate racemase [Amycolatopsis bartoniae]
MLTPTTAIIGILGGMGPLATADLYRKIIHSTPAARDQDHLPVVVWADPSVPDRTTALTARGADPTPWLIRGAHRLEALGADVIAVPCNTAHAFLPEVRNTARARIMDMIEETSRYVTRELPHIATVGVLASAGVVQAGLYHGPLERAGLTVLVPEEPSQRAHVSAAIRLIKGGDTGEAPRQALTQAARALVARGAEALIAGCTEFPLVLISTAAGLPVIDPTWVLARATVRAAREWTTDALADRRANNPS